jgi:hypothetical protein
MNEFRTTGLMMTEMTKAELIGREWDLMGRIEHITTQQIIGEWGSIENFAASHPEVVTGLKRRGFWAALEKGEGAGEL